MAKRPPKPDGVDSKPRVKASEPQSFSSAVEAARKLIEASADLAAPIKGEYINSDDRSFAITRTADVDSALQHAISNVIHIRKGDGRELFKSSGPMGTFSNKIIMAYALDVIGPVTKSNLETMRHIRNVFAHARAKVSFDTKEIVSLCKFIVLPKMTVMPGDLSEDNRFTNEEKSKVSTLSDQRIVFMTCALVSLVSLRKFSRNIIETKLKQVNPDYVEEKDRDLIRFDQSLP